MSKFTKELQQRIRVRGPKIGYCVICGEYGALSRDHVPPKGCNNLNDVEINALLPSGDFSIRGATSQHGTNFRTICFECNNTRLGAIYDPALIAFSNELTAWVVGAKNKIIHLPRSVFPFIRSQRIAKALVGHVLAGLSVEEAQHGLIESPMSNILREYFLDEDTPLPEALDIYFWLYPSRRQVLIKNVGKSVVDAQNHRRTVFGHIIKFLPFGFWLVYNSHNLESELVKPLIRDKSVGLDSAEQIEVRLYNAPSLDFPERPEGYEFTAFNSAYAVEAKEKK